MGNIDERGNTSERATPSERAGGFGRAKDAEGRIIELATPKKKKTGGLDAEGRVAQKGVFLDFCPPC